MNIVNQDMINALEQFLSDKGEYEALLDQTSLELVHSSRIVKKEIIDMSDTMDKMCGIILNQELKI